jgi:hypothetical protein
MTQLRSWVPGRALLLTAALRGGFGCSYSETDDGSSNVNININPDYILGGQTGSLVPDCGLAPLSMAGHSVPAGEALAVLYAGNCPAPIAQQLMLEGAGGVTLVPLQSGNVFLVRAERTLSQGEYQLDLGTGSPSDVRVSDSEVDVPELGALSMVPEGAECGEPITFELALDAAALAYAPLSRFELRLDGGTAQVWVDYGALPIESSAEGSSGQLELPRCGARNCLWSGVHQLELSMLVAGASVQPKPVELTFDVRCPAPEESAVAPVSDTDAGCSVVGSGPGSSAARMLPGVLVLCLGWLGFSRRRTRRLR